MAARRHARPRPRHGRRPRDRPALWLRIDWSDTIAATFVIDPTVIDGASEHLVPMPRTRTHATFVWDEARSRALLFGGRALYGPRSFADLWALELVAH